MKKGYYSRSRSRSRSRSSIDILKAPKTISKHISKAPNSNSRNNLSTGGTVKNTPWRGWKKAVPTRKERTQMLSKCGKKCFLGPGKSYPICKRGTCKVDKRGVYAAYVRSRQYHKNAITKRAKKLLQ